MLTVNESAKLILEKGPLTRAELLELSEPQRTDYFAVMSMRMDKIGPEEFVKRREGLGEAYLEELANGDVPSI